MKYLLIYVHACVISFQFTGCHPCIYLPKQKHAFPSLITINMSQCPVLQGFLAAIGASVLIDISSLSQQCCLAPHFTCDANGLITDMFHFIIVVIYQIWHYEGPSLIPFKLFPSLSA
jgi:hypothetical protein